MDAAAQFQALCTPFLRPTAAFGQQPSTSQPAGGGFSFGQTQTQQPASSFSFGATTQQPASTSGAFSFGGTSQPASTSAPSLFGSTTSTQPASTGFSFGSASQPAQQQQQQPSSGLFGNTGTQQTGLFGSTAAAPQPATTGLFGSSTGTGLFGSTAAAPQPAATGLFGSSTGTGLFGSTAAAPQPATTGLFGSSTGTGLFQAQQQPAVQADPRGLNWQDLSQNPWMLELERLVREHRQAARDLEDKIKAGFIGEEGRAAWGFDRVARPGASVVQRGGGSLLRSGPRCAA